MCHLMEVSAGMKAAIILQCVSVWDDTLYTLKVYNVTHQ